MKRILIYNLLICFFCFINAANVKTVEQIKKDKKKEKKQVRDYRIINSNKLFVEKRENSYITHLKGDVHFFYNEIEFFADDARIFDNQNRVELFGNVKVIEDSITIQTENLTYTKKDNILMLVKNVFIREEHSDGTIRTFASQQAKYFKNIGKLIATKNVRIFDEKKKLTAYCGYLEYDMSKSYGYMIKSPEIFSTEKDSLTIKGEKIEYFDNYKKIVVQFNVETKSVFHRTESDFLVYFRDSEKIVLSGSPKFFSGQADANADKFYIYLKNNQVDSVVFEDNCIAFFSNKENGEKSNILTSDLMKMDFDNSKIKNFKAIKNTEILLKSETDNNFSLNKVNGDTLTVFVNEKSDVQDLVVNSNVSGKYYFYKEIKDNEK